MSAFLFIFVTTIKTRSEQKFIAVDALSSLLSEAIYTLAMTAQLLLPTLNLKLFN